MNCNKCKNRVVMHAFSFDECTLCGKEISCVDTPVDKVCEACAVSNNICNFCGDAL